MMELFIEKLLTIFARKLIIYVRQDLKYDFDNFVSLGLTVKLRPVCKA